MGNHQADHQEALGGIDQSLPLDEPGLDPLFFCENSFMAISRIVIRPP